MLLAVDLSNGSVRWQTGRLANGAPELALVTPATVVLRGAPAPDLTEDLYGVNAHTGAVVWSKACSRACVVLPVDDGRTAIISSFEFTVSELEAVDLATGRVVWRGSESSTDLSTSCSGLVVAHRHLYFGCSCGDEEAAEGAGEEGVTEEGTGMLTAHQGKSAAGWLAGGGVVALNGGRLRAPLAGAEAEAAAAEEQQQLLRQWEEAQQGALVQRPGARTALAADRGATRGSLGRRERKDGELCGFALSAEDGEPGWRTVLHDDSQFPAAAGSPGLLPLITQDTVVLVTQAAVHCLDRVSGRHVWSFFLPEGQSVQAWDSLAYDGRLLLLRSSGVPPQPSRLFGLTLTHGSLMVNISLPSSYSPRGGQPLTEAMRDDMAYLDTCSGQHCCLYAVDLLAGPGSGGAPAAGGNVSDRSWQYCFNVQQVCRHGQARSVGLTIIYLLLVAQLAVILVGFGASCAYRTCCRRRYAPFTRYNALPILQVLTEHDDASEEADGEFAEERAPRVVLVEAGPDGRPTAEGRAAVEAALISSRCAAVAPRATVN